MARAPSTGPRAGTWLAACMLGAVLAAGACRAPSPATPQPAPVRLAIGYGGSGGAPNVGLRAFSYLISTERLVQLRRNGRVEPALAERWEQSSDGLTWRFTLRPNLTFHDGTRLDAAIIALRLQESLKERPRSPGFKDVLMIRAQDTRTIVFTLRRPSGLLLDSLSLLAISRDGDERISAGPFRPVSSTESQIAFEAFPQYYRGRPTLDRVELKLYPNARNAWAAMMRGEIDMLYEVAPEALDFIEQSSETQVRSFQRPYVFTMNLNLRHPILMRRNVRLALNHAVNRTAIIAQVFRGHGHPATDHVWPWHWAHDSMLPRLSYDPLEASRLLDEEGLRLPAMTDRSAHEESASRFQFTCIIPEHEMRLERIALMLQRQLMEVGIDMRLQSVSWAELGQRTFRGQFEAFLVDLISTPGLDRLYQVWHSIDTQPEYFDPGYTAADEPLDRLLNARNDNETRAAIYSLQRVMRDDPPAVFLLWSETSRAVSARFRVPLTPDRDIFSTLGQWQLAPASTSSLFAP